MPVPAAVCHRLPHQMGRSTYVMPTYIHTNSHPLPSKHFKQRTLEDNSMITMLIIFADLDISDDNDDDALLRMEL